MRESNSISPPDRSLNLTLTPPSLFHYLPDHRVLICIPCRYAVQPSAVMRHLKEIHHLKHIQRGPFIEYASQYLLADPKEVVLPDESQFPVPFLPVLEGLACQYPGCDHLCVTAKRMRHHCSTIHHITGKEGWDWYPVQLQTFFRGNALRYFSNYASVTPREESLDGGVSRSDTRSSSTRATSTPASDLLPNPPSSIASLNEADSTLLQHYLNVTHLTLAPSPETEYIFRVTVPQLAGEFPFLMHGLLATAALHLAYDDPTNRSHYVLQALHHQELSMPAFQQAILNVNKHNCEAILVFAFVLVVCALGQDDNGGGKLFIFHSTPNAGSGTSTPQAIHLLRGGCSMLCSVWPIITTGPLAPLAELWREDLGVSVDLDTNPILHSLLAVMPGGLGFDPFWTWSDWEIDAYHTSAVKLAEAFAFADQRGQAFTIWDALNAWPLRVPPEYLDLLQANHPGALLLLAHYSLLLQRLKPSWFFIGQVPRLLDSIQGRLQGSGIGKACALAFAKQGAAGVVFVDLHIFFAEKVAAESRTLATNPAYKALALAVDITDAEQVDGMVSKTREEFERIDYVVNCAGIGVEVPVEFAETPIPEFSRFLNVNVMGTFLVTRAVSRAMKKQEPLPVSESCPERGTWRGSIVNLASCSSFASTPLLTQYTTSKHAVLGLTRNAALDNSKYGIRVNCLCPSWVQKPMIERAMEGNPGLREVMDKAVPLGRIAHVDEIADVAVFLSSPKASYVVGSSWIIDGGTTLTARL